MKIEIPSFFTEPEGAESSPASTPEQAPLLAKEAKERAYTAAQSLSVYNQYQANIRQSSQLKAEMLKGAKEGESIYSLFLKACKAITLMTGESIFYDTIKADTLEIYGTGFEEAQPLQTDIAETRERLQMLQRAAESEPASQNIKKAIQAHKERIARLERKLQQ